MDRLYGLNLDQSRPSRPIVGPSGALSRYAFIDAMGGCKLLKLCLKAFAVRSCYDNFMIPPSPQLLLGSKIFSSEYNGHQSAKTGAEIPTPPYSIGSLLTQPTFSVTRVTETLKSGSPKA